MTEQEVSDFIAGPEYRRICTDPGFLERGLELERRLATEPLTVQQAADLMRMPVDVFRHIYARHLALEKLKSNFGTEH